MTKDQIIMNYLGWRISNLDIKKYQTDNTHKEVWMMTFTACGNFLYIDENARLCKIDRFRNEMMEFFCIDHHLMIQEYIKTFNCISLI